MKIARAGGCALAASLARAVERRGFRHTLSPGTVVFHDWRGERQKPNSGLVPTAVVMSRVVSLPEPGRVRKFF